MKATDLSQAITICIATQQPVIIWGEPGGGKSSVAKSTIRALGFNPIDLRCSTMDAVDQRGLPMIDKDGRTNWALPSFLPRTSKQVILFDDFPQAPISVMNGASELILDRTQNGKENYVLPDDTGIIATGNTKKHRAGTNDLPTHLRNRFVHINFETDVDDWVRWSMDVDALPNVTLPETERVTKMADEIISFHRFRPNLLHQFDTVAYAFPSPRSVSFLNKLLPHLKKATHLQYEMIAGCCGEGYATEFTGYLRLITRMPNPDLVFKDPDNAPIPEEPGIKYALCVALASRVTKKTADPLFRYLNRFDQDFAVVCAKDAINKDVRILQCAEGQKWGQKNAPFLLG